MATLERPYKKLRETLSLIYIVMVYVICIPVCVYGIYRYCIDRNNMNIKKRHTSITLLLILTSLCCLVLQSMLLFANGLYFCCWNESVSDILFVSLQSLSISQIIELVFRSWINYYDIKLMTTMISIDSWEYILNPSSKETNFFIQNKLKYGSPKYWYKYAIIILLFVSLSKIIPYILLINYPEPQRFVKLSMTLIIAVTFGPLLIYIRYKTPKFDDHFWIRKEIKYVFFTLIFGVFILILQAIISKVVDDRMKIIVELTKDFIWCLIWCVLVVIMTLIVIYKTNIKDLHYDQLNQMVEIVSMSSSASPPHWSLKKILANKKGFELFALHLAKEFSIEVLLSLVEFTQFKQRLCNEFNMDNQYEKDNVKLILYDQIPESFLVYGDLEDKYFGYNTNKIMEFKIRAFELYEKYIKTSSLYEINIQYSTRLHLVNEMNDFNRWIANDEINELLLNKLFDKSIEETNLLLQYSYSRFRGTDQFMKLSSIHH